VPSGTDSQTYFGAQPLHCLRFLLFFSALEHLNIFF